MSALQLDPKILADLLLDPKFAAEALMGWKLDDYQSAALKLDWWFPTTLDCSGTMSGKTLRSFILLNLRCMLLPDHVAAAYFPTWSAGQQEFWPYFQATLDKPGGAAAFYRAQCRMHRRKVGESKGPSCWIWSFDDGSRIEMPAPGFINDARTQAGRSFHTLFIDECFKVMEMGEGISEQLMERWRKPLPVRWKGHVNCPVRGNHLHLKGHAQKLSHKGYQFYKALKGEIRKGSANTAVYSFCVEDISEKFTYIKPTKILANQRAALSPDDYKRQILGLWAHDGATFYPHGILARGAQDILPELGRSSGDAHYFLGFDVAPGQSVKADWCAAKVLRLRPVPVAELPRLMSAGVSRCFRIGNTAWELTFVHGWMGRGLRAGELAGFIHWLDQRFNFSLICMDPGGGGQWVRAELLKHEAEWGGQSRKVTPICTRTELNYHDKRPILHMFRRGGDFDGLPFVGPEFAKGDDGFLAAAHLNYRMRWERGEMGYPAPVAARPRGEVEAFWPADMLAAQRTIEEGVRQLGKVTQQTDANGHPLVSRAGFSLFHSPTKKDVAYAGLYASMAAELWLWTNFGDGGGQGNGEDSDGVYV